MTLPTRTFLEKLKSLTKMNEKEFVKLLRKKYKEDFSEKAEEDMKKYAEALEMLLYHRGVNTLDKEGWN
ncbi:MAG: hypothetical protein JW708_08940 [Vallitaleaceae bacterium]|nr:hypothetical protein [Vallitaleaceae bacterium]